MVILATGKGRCNQRYLKTLWAGSKPDSAPDSAPNKAHPGLRVVVTGRLEFPRGMRPAVGIAKRRPLRRGENSPLGAKLLARRQGHARSRAQRLERIGVLGTQWILDEERQIGELEKGVEAEKGFFRKNWPIIAAGGAALAVPMLMGDQ